MSRHAALALSLVSLLLLSSAPALAGATKAPQRSLVLRQRGSSASFEKKVGRRYRLTVHGVPRRSTYIATHPLRVDHRVATGKALRWLFAHGSRLGAIEAPGDRRGQDAVAAMLSEPEYDAAAGTLSYTAKLLPRTLGSGVTPAGLEVDETLPTELGETTVNLGGPHDGLSCLGELSVGKEELESFPYQEAEWQKILGFSKWSTDSWAPEPIPGTTEGGSHANYLEWRSNGGDDRGCHNQVEFEGRRAFPEEPSGLKLNAEMTYDWGNHAHTSCVVTPTAPNPRVCEVSTWKEGLFDSDLRARFYGADFYPPKDYPPSP